LITVLLGVASVFFWRDLTLLPVTKFDGSLGCLRSAHVLAFEHEALVQETLVGETSA